MKKYMYIYMEYFSKDQTVLFIWRPNSSQSTSVEFGHSGSGDQVIWRNTASFYFLDK